MVWPYETAQNFLEQMRYGIHQVDRHFYQPVTVVYARKPPRNADTLSWD
jgi:hypothetical protein